MPVAVLIAAFGLDNVFSQIAILFSKMALLSLGGPYAVNSYVAVHAVEPYAWLTHKEALDGLALAELAPGPVILFQQFVGFLAAYGHPGVLPPIAAGILGGLLSIWIISIPSFLWIFLVGPFMERFRDNKLINATLSAVTGGVLGVVLTFAVRFGTRTIFLSASRSAPLGLISLFPDFASADPWALAIAIVAGIAMFCFGLGMVATPSGVLCGRHHSVFDRHNRNGNSAHRFTWACGRRCDRIPSRSGCGLVPASSHSATTRNGACDRCRQRDR